MEKHEQLEKPRVALILLLLMSAVLLATQPCHIFGLTAGEVELVKNKFEPWLWEKLQQLEANGTTRLMSIIVCVQEGSSYDFRTKVATLLASRHSAAILYIGTVLSFVNIQVMSTEVKKIAIYWFVDGLSDGEAVIKGC